MGSFSTFHWLIVLIIVLLLFGNRLPSMMRSLGRGVTEFKKGLEGGGDDDDEDGSKKGKRKEVEAADEEDLKAKKEKPDKQPAEK